MNILVILVQSAAGFSDMDAPTSAYEKTQPFEACMFFFCSREAEITITSR